MALNNFSTDLFTVTVNGRTISDWGETDPPYTDDPIDPKSTMRRGQGGNAIGLDRINPGRTVTLQLNPGGDDASFPEHLAATLTVHIGTEGRIVNDTSKGRGGQTITDRGFIMEFNVWTSLA